MVTVWTDPQTAKKARSDIFDAATKPLMAQHFDNVVNQLMPDLLANYRPQPPQPAPQDQVAGAASVPPPSPPMPAAPVPPPVAATPAVPPPPTSTGDYTQAITTAAQKYGIDPNVALRVADSEGGRAAGAAGDANSSFSPFQLHYGGVAPGGNSVAGLGDEFTRQTGLDARDPANTEAAIDFALKHASQNGWGAFHGAARVGIGERDGIVGRSGGGEPSGMPAPVGSATATVPAARTDSAPAERTSQFGMGLSSEDAYAFCGPAAAIAFANTYGRNPTVDEAKKLAQQYGWTNGQGMAGVQSEQKMLNDGLGIPTKLETQVDWSHVASDATNGNPVIISTPGHYFYVSGARASSGGQQEFYVGTSGTDLKGGSAWMTPDQMQARMGQVQGALYADNPQSPGQSVASTGQSNPIGDFFSGVGSAAKGAVDAIGGALPNFNPTLDPNSPVAQQARGEHPSPFAVKDQAAQGLSEQIVPPNTPVLSGAARTLADPTTYMGGLGGVAPMLGAAAGGTVAREATKAVGGDETAQGVAELGGSLAGGALPYGKMAGAALNKGLGTLDTLRPPSVAYASTVEGDAARQATGVVPTTPPTTEPHGLNINLPKYTPPEVRDVIQSAYDAHPEIMDQARRGVIPDDVVKQLADQVGRTPQQIAALWKPGQAKNAETILALRQGLADQSQQVLAAQAALKTNPSDPQAISDLTQALTRHAAVQEVVSGVTAEAGRALRQFRQPVEGTEASLQTLQRLARQWKVSPDELGAAISKADLNDPVQVAGLARNLVKHSPADKLSALWYFNLLSNPLSHIRNIVSNSVAAAVAPLEVIPSAAADAVRVGLRGGQRERYFGELGARYVGLSAGMREGVQNGLQILSHGFTDAQAAGQLTGTGAAREAFSGPVGMVINAPGRALGAEDAFFRAMNKTASLYAGAYRTASQEGLKGRALIERVTQLRAAPPTELLKEAEGEAAFRVFQSPSDLADALSSVTTKVPALKVVLPFVRTPINIAKYVLQYSPVGAATLGYDAVRGKAGSVGQIEDRIARVGIGSTILAGLYLWAQDGNLTGAAPDSATERDAYLRQHPAYSMRIGDTWHSYQALQPFSSLFAAVASIHDAQQRGVKLSDTAAATTLAFAIGKSLTDMPWTQGLTQALEAQHNPQQMGGAYAESMARSVAFPTSVWSFVNRATDNMLRSPDGPGEAFVSQFPGLTGAAKPRQDAFGRDVQRPPEQMGLGALNPFNPAPDKTGDPVEKALADLQGKGYTVEPGFVGDKMTVTGIPAQATLTEDERRQIMRVSGQLAYGVLLSMVTAPGWDKAPAQERAKAVDAVINKTRDYARTQLMPQVAPRAVQALTDELGSGIRKPAAKP